MTSNLGSNLIMENDIRDETTFQQAKDRVMALLRASFRPEFLNRVDEIVVFHPLTREHLRKIVKIQSSRLVKRLLEQHFKLEITGEAEEYLAEKGYDPVYGARPLKRTIQKELETPLATSGTQL